VIKDRGIILVDYNQVLNNPDWETAIN